MLLVDDGCVLAALDILSKDIAHRGQRCAASGVSSVVTDRIHRGKGYARRLVHAARREWAAGRVADVEVVERLGRTAGGKMPSSSRIKNEAALPDGVALDVLDRPVASSAGPLGVRVEQRAGRRERLAGLQQRLQTGQDHRPAAVELRVGALGKLVVDHGQPA
jgi:GNAT superfamily N-acetyltransferase